ncbi:3-dehydroquinate synthase II [Streptomyces stelliscabiei]
MLVSAEPAAALARKPADKLADKGGKEAKGAGDAKSSGAGGTLTDAGSTSCCGGSPRRTSWTRSRAENRAAVRVPASGGPASGAPVTAAPVAGFVDVRDDRTLQLSCVGAMALPYTVIHFADPTKIPLEIVLAAAESAEGKLVTVVGDLEEAAIVFDVLERGSDGILFTPRSADDVFALARLLRRRPRSLSCPR